MNAQIYHLKSKTKLNKFSHKKINCYCKTRKKSKHLCLKFYKKYLSREKLIVFDFFAII
jgi:hypothetical protein